jgi:hypothetical protein
VRAGDLREYLVSRRVQCAVIVLVSALGVPAARVDAAAPRRVFVIGDSVTLGAEYAIESQAPGHGWSATIDAKGRPHHC